MKKILFDPKYELNLAKYAYKNTGIIGFNGP